MKLKKPKLRVPKIQLKVFAITVVALVLSTAIFYVFSNDKKEPKIGDTKITQEQIDRYIKEIEEYNTRYPESKFEGDFREIAIDDLVLNAAFKDEAKKRGQPLTDDEIIAFKGEEFNDEDEKQHYIEVFQTSNLMRRTRTENEAYKEKFKDVLIAQKDLLVVTATFTSPIHTSVPANKVQALYDEGLRKIKEIEPLMVSGASRDEIAKKVDVATYDANTSDEEDPNVYFTKVVTLADYMKGVSGDDVFNDQDATDYIRGDVGTMEDTDAKVAQLKNVGDTTGVFTAKIGARTIIRLEATNGGEYSTWTEFLDSYKEKYVIGLSDTIETRIGSKVKGTINQTIRSITSVGLEKAKAHNVSDPDCGSGHHHVTIYIRAIDVDTNQSISGARVRQKQPQNPQFPGCPAPDGTRTTGGGWTSFEDIHCWNPTPVWTLLQDANTTKYERANRFIESHGGFTFTGQYALSGYDNDNSPRGEDGPNRWGFPHKWHPQVANNTRNIYITLRYKEKPDWKGPPTVNIQVTCTQIRVTNVRDPDSPSTPLNFKIWKGSAGSGDGNLRYESPPRINGSKNFDIKNVDDNPGLNGQRFTIRVFGVNRFGDESPLDSRYRYTDASATAPSNCYRATCTVTVYGNVPGRPQGAGQNDIKANSSFWVDTRVNNTGQKGLKGTEHNLLLISGNSWSPYASRDPGQVIARSDGVKLQQDVPSATSRIARYEATAPNVRQTLTFPVTVQYQGVNMANCSVQVRVFQYFDLDPGVKVTLSPDKEEPNNVRFELWANGYNGLQVQYTARDTYEPYGGSCPNYLYPGSATSLTWGTTPNIHTNNRPPKPPSCPTPPKAGDNFCITAYIEQKRGWAGPGNQLFGQIDEHWSGRTCDNVHDEPYLRVFGDDVLAGGGFANEGNCRNPSAGIHAAIRNSTYPQSSPPRSGSGAQLAAIANGAINGFTSASIRTAVPRLPDGLSFARPSGTFGGGFGGSFCAADFYGTTQDNPTPFGSAISISAALDGQHKSTGSGPGNDVTINGGTVGVGKRIAIYIDGDVRITGTGIRYATGYANVNQIPSFALIVRGNIYIASTVTQLDGLYVAQAGAAGPGKIYTCSTGFSRVSDSAIYNACDQQLVINGGFIANEVRFLRSFKSLRNSTGLEQAGLPCPDPRPALNRNSCAAELFSLSPELYLARPAFRPAGSSSTGDFDYITTLPPIL